MSWLELASYWHEIQTPGGIGTSTNGQVLFNSSGSVAGDAGLTYDSGTDTLSAGNLALPTAGTITLGTTISITRADDYIAKITDGGAGYGYLKVSGMLFGASGATGLSTPSAAVLKVTDGGAGIGALMSYIPAYADNAAALAALGAGRLYYTDTAGEYIVKVSH